MGALGTTAGSPSGIDGPGIDIWSTPHDLAVIFRAAMAALAVGQGIPPGQAVHDRQDPGMGRHQGLQRGGHRRDLVALQRGDDDVLRGQLGRIADGVQRDVIVVEGIWPNGTFEGGRGINVLVGADSPPPAGGAAFHDTAVWVRPA